MAQEPSERLTGQDHLLLRCSGCNYGVTLPSTEG
jgi:hypothetical protein